MARPPASKCAIAATISARLGFRSGTARLAIEEAPLRRAASRAYRSSPAGAVNRFLRTDHPGARGHYTATPATSAPTIPAPPGCRGAATASDLCTGNSGARPLAAAPRTNADNPLETPVAPARVVNPGKIENPFEGACRPAQPSPAAAPTVQRPLPRLPRTIDAGAGAAAAAIQRPLLRAAGQGAAGAPCGPPRFRLPHEPPPPARSANGSSKTVIGRVRIEECGKALCGVVSSAKDPNDTDRKNPDPKKRKRPIIGTPVLLDMQPTRENRWEGEVYNVRDGQTYTAKLSMRNPGTLRLEGCVMGGMFCGGQNWKRVQ